MSEQTAISKPIDKWIPWFFVLFFLVIAVLDGIFVTLAIRTHTGIVTENAYEKGLAYNQTLKNAHAQDILGWQSDIKVESGNLVATLADQDGIPLEYATVVAKAIRPVQDGYDFELELVDRGKGVYSAPAEFPLSGQWSIRIFATWQGTPYQNSKIIIVR